MSYKSYQFDKIFNDVVRATGRPLSAIDSFSTDEAERWADLINEALREIFEHEFWPGTVVVEQRAIDTDDLYILKEESGEQYIGLIRPDECFFEAEPDPESRYGVLGGVEDRGDRIVCFDDDCPASPYVRYQIPCPKFTRTAYAAGTTYGLDDLVYDSTTGECYTSAQAANTGNAVTDTAWWTKVLFPEMFQPFVKLKASAERMLEADGMGAQFGRATREMNRLEDKLISPRKAAR